MGACHMWWQPVCAILPWHALAWPEHALRLHSHWHLLRWFGEKYYPRGGGFEPPKSGGSLEKGLWCPKAYFFDSDNLLEKFLGFGDPPPPPNAYLRTISASWGSL